MRAGISLDYGTDLKVPPTIGVHSGPPRSLDQSKLDISYQQVRRSADIRLFYLNQNSQFDV